MSTDLGPKSRTLIDYFESNGADKCPADANPAEWMLDVIKPSTEEDSAIDWHQTWRNSREFVEVKAELTRLRGLASNKATSANIDDHPSQHDEFVTSFRTQFWQVLKRTWMHFWRSPTYIWSKTTMILLSVRGNLVFSTKP